ncbi:hypothetical protein A9X63_27030 [Klebsiella pneumoniae]|nr:hypothetical protein A9X63_27030 [Klebsiella pneumoniae]
MLMKLMLSLVILFYSFGVSSTEDDSMEDFEDEAPDADLHLSEMGFEDDRTSALTESMISTLLSLTKDS